MKTVRVGIVLGLVTFAVVFALYLGRAGLASARESRPGSLPPSANMQEWLTYTDERFNFSIQYPPDWYINIVPADAAGGGVQISTYNPYDISRNQKQIPADYFKIEIMVVGGDPLKPGQSLAEWRHARADYLAYVKSEVREEKLTYLNGLEGLEERVEYAPSSETVTIYHNYLDDSYGSTVLYISAGPFQQPAMEASFRQILSTFQLKK